MELHEVRTIQPTTQEERLRMLNGTAKAFSRAVHDLVGDSVTYNSDIQKEILRLHARVLGWATINDSSNHALR